MRDFKRGVVGLFLLFVFTFPAIADARISKRFKTDFEAIFTPAVPHNGLLTASEQLEQDKLRAFAVVKIGDRIAAERAYYFVSPTEYDYRGNVVDGEQIRTRQGRAYTYLLRGTIMAVAGIAYSGRYVYVKLISLEKIKSEAKPKLKPTRVTCMIGFKFSRSVFEGDNMDTVFSTIYEWIVPFQNSQDALRYSNELTYEPAPTAPK